MATTQAMMTAISTGNTRGTESRRVSIELPVDARERQPSSGLGPAPIQCVASKTTGSLPDNIAKKPHSRPSVVIPGESPFAMANQNSRRVSNGSIFPEEGMYNTLTSGMLGGGPVSKTGSMSNQHTNSSRRRASSVSMMSSLTSFNGRRYSIPATPESRYWPSDVGAMGFCQSNMTSLASLSLYPTNSLYQMPELGEASMTSTISGIEGASSSNGYQGYGGGGLAASMSGADLTEAPMVSAMSSSIEAGSANGYPSYLAPPPGGHMSMIPSASSSSTPLSAQNSGLVGMPVGGYPQPSHTNRNYVGGVMSPQLQAAQAAAMVPPHSMQTPPMHHPQPHLNQLQQQLLQSQPPPVPPPPPPPPSSSQLHHTQMLLHQPDSMGPTNTVRSGGSPPPVSTSAPPVNLQQHQQHQQVYMAGQLPPGAYYHGNYVVQLPPASTSGSGAGLGPPGPHGAGGGGPPPSRGYPQVVGGGGLGPPQIAPGYACGGSAGAGGGSCAASLSGQSMSPHTTGATGSAAPMPVQPQVSAPPSHAGPSSAVVGGAGNREPVTTIMLRNIPQRFNRESLMDDMDARGFMGSYDFFYLPIDFSTTHSVGYAFINFVSEAELARFKSVYIGLKLSEDSPKVCAVVDAKVQGKAKNVDFYRNSTVMGMDEKYHPVLLENGNRLPFPRPTRPVGPVQRRPPRVGGQMKH